MMLLIVLGLLSACVPEMPEVRTNQEGNSNLNSQSNNPYNNQNAGGSSVTNNDDELHYDSNSINFFQSGALTSSIMNLPADFNDTFSLKGNDIHKYVSLHKADDSYVCMAIHYPNSLENTVLVLSAKFKQIVNFASNQVEDYLLINSNEIVNQYDCSGSTIQNAIALEFNGDVSYTPSSLCTNCTLAFSNNKTSFFSTNGDQIEQIRTSHLIIVFDPVGQSSNSGGSNTGGNLSCTETTACSGQGYNCCLQGQCVNDGELKPDADTASQAYFLAYLAVNANPSSFRNYPEFYFICAEEVATTPVNSGTISSTNQLTNAQILIETLKGYRDCVNTDQDEMSICTIRYENASSYIVQDPNDLTSNGYAFSAGIDDLNFTSTGAIESDVSNITEVSYGGVVLYKEDIFDMGEEFLELQAETINDDLETAMEVIVKANLVSSALEDTVIVKYKVDGSCEKLNANLGRCKKYYKQGQSSEPARPSDHEDGETAFALPIYANLSYSVTVSVNGINIGQGESTWEIADQSIEFSMPVYTNQEVIITYFVTDDYVEFLTTSKDLAQAQINLHCNCGTSKCNLDPVYVLENGNQTLKSFNCVYPQTVVINAPTQQVAYVSAKSAPHRYFDENGVVYDENISAASTQEGVEFEYISNNTLYPNNIGTDVGFNEIYGSFNKTANAARPPEVIALKKGKTYDLYVDLGSYSSCINCGSDYYSSLQKLFPQNFSYRGGGYKPDSVETNRFNNQGKYRSDDLLFGRACFVPATMIPFTHQAYEDVQSQRMARLAGQHFLFANGYNRDWYGFDYGSLIGSFDGVRWFSIGNARRIQATSNKLFLAVNSFFGDQTNLSDFKVVISEMTTNSSVSLDINYDVQSDGAECQKNHVCSSDDDCIRNLGYDYTCQAVSGINTTWPTFDVNANEIPGSANYRLLSAIIGGTNGQNKRCVYRGRGSLCLANPYETSESYAYSSNAGIHACSANSHCQSLMDDSESAVEKFNRRIARFARSAGSQNNDETVVENAGITDTFGLGARLIGRPFNYFGNEPATDEVIEHFSSLGVTSVCIPGKDTSASDFSSQHSSEAEAIADKILGIGLTPSEDSSQFYSSCPTTDEDGFYLNLNGDASLDSEVIRSRSATQNISSALLTHDSFATLNLFADTEEYILGAGINSNSCLRAAGASCFSDFDCAPSKYIGDKVLSITDFGSLNEAESAFWEESLICGQDKEKYLPLSTLRNPDYDLNNNKCCRESGNQITVYSEDIESPTFFTDKVAGLDDISINDDMRYSRVNTVYDKLTTEPNKYPALKSPASNTGTTDLNDLLRQYNTFHLAASRTCCSGNWVRKFSEDNGNDHHWVEGKTQRIPFESFKCISWEKSSGVNISGLNQQFSCHPLAWDTSECEIKSLSQIEQEKYLKWLEKLELTGISQIAIETSETIKCLVDNVQNDITSTDLPLSKTIKQDAIPQIVDDNGTNYLSAGNMDNFHSGAGEIKQIFDSNKVNCCIPSGQQVASSVTDEQCCTGKTFQNRCCLEDYTDISVYLNRYVSSEASDVSDSLIDPETGYIKDAGTVMQIAQQKNLCCSGKLSYGHAIHSLMIPGSESVAEARVTRFIYSDGQTDNNSETGSIGEIYEKGVRWNNHVYCVPSSFQDPPTE